MISTVGRGISAAIVGVALAAGAAAAQGAGGGAQRLSLEEALRVAESQSEAIQIARAGVMRAEGQQMQAKSQYMPQLSGSLAYQRTLKSQFSALQSTSAPMVPPEGTPPVPAPDPTKYYAPCSRYLPQDPNAATATRVAQLEQYARCQAASSSTGGIDFSKVGFGAKNQFNLGLTGLVNLFTGGRVQAQNAAAVAGRRTAEIELAAQRAQVQLTVAQAYYDAVLSDRLLAIAESSLVQTEATFRQTQLARQVGNTSEFEMLRAQVTRDNQRPMVIERRTQRDLARLQLKQLLNLPLDQPLTLTTDLQDVGPAVPVRIADGAAGRDGAAQPAAADTSADDRAPVRQAAQAIRAQEEQFRIAKSQRLPSLSLSTQYGRVAFPSSGIPSLGDFLTNWTVGVSASFPIFTGGRIKGDELVARAGVLEAQQRFQQVRELASLDARRALAALDEAQAAWEASRGTTEQAARAYTIAEVRFREGISTQLELNDSRILLQQSQATRAQAARDLQLARLRLALLRDLPLSAGGAGASAGSGGASQTGGAATQSQQQAPQQRSTQTPGSITGTGPGQ